MPRKSWRVTSKRTSRRSCGLSILFRACPCLARNNRRDVNFVSASLRHCTDILQLCDAGVDLVVAPTLCHGRRMEGKYVWGHPVQSKVGVRSTTVLAYQLRPRRPHRPWADNGVRAPEEKTAFSFLKKGASSSCHYVIVRRLRFDLGKGCAMTIAN